jgi:hypothetical protein
MTYFRRMKITETFRKLPQFGRNKTNKQTNKLTKETLTKAQNNTTSHESYARRQRKSADLGYIQ